MIKADDILTAAYRDLCRESRSLGDVKDLAASVVLNARKYLRHGPKMTSVDYLLQALEEKQ